MQICDVKIFSRLMAGVGELYGKTISGALTRIYWQTLKCYDIEDVQRAFNAHIHNPDCGQFFPKPADIVRFIEGSNETRALFAWTIVEKAITQVGIYQSVVFDDPLIHAVLEDMGGWVKLCTLTNIEMPFRANEFQKRYLGFLLKKPNRYPRYLCGIIECENTKNGYDCEAPLLLGDASKAEAIMRTGNGTSLLQQQSSKAFSSLILQISQSLPANKKDKS